MGFYSMASNIPKHGEPIIEKKAGQLCGDKFIASFQFQRFLDELGALFDVQSDGESQEVFSLSVQLGANSAKIAATISQMEEVTQYMASIEAENTQLKALMKAQVDAFTDLEQVVYGNIS
jgi:hypothetical protein